MSRAFIKCWHDDMKDYAMKDKQTQTEPDTTTDPDIPIFPRRYRIWKLEVTRWGWRSWHVRF